ncbi:MAG: S1 RNA-binding domain-containing protein, partial [Chthoniobacterales bacterium]
VLLVRLENEDGMVILSKERAAYRQNWDKISKVFNDEGIIKGRVKAVVKGGLIVNIGVEAFLPSSQIDIIPPKDLNQFVGNTYDFKIVKLSDERRNVVLSVRELIEQERSEKRQEFMSNTEVGSLVNGTVKNLTDFGAFIDLGGMDGLLHITDMTWGRLTHPSELLKVGQEIQLQVLEINTDKERVSLGLKQTTDNPWDKIEERFPTGTKVKGKITNLVPYGAFVEIEPGVEGLIHVSELSWTKRITRPSDVLTAGQEVEAVVLGVNKDEQKISLGVRQLEPNPWDEIEQRYIIGKQVKGKVRNMTAYGAFVELEEGIDGMVHVSDLSWTRKINHPSEVLKKGDEIDAVVIDIDKAN